MDESASWPHDEVLHAWWVRPGRLPAGEYPGPRTPEKTAKKLQLLADAGIDTMIDLTRPEDGLEPYQEALPAVRESIGRELRHYAHPIPDMGVLDQASYDRIVGFIRSENDKGRTVYLHCWGGQGRTTTVVGCLFIDDGLDYDATIARIAEMRAGTHKAGERCPNPNRSVGHFGSGPHGA